MIETDVRAYLAFCDLHHGRVIERIPALPTAVDDYRRALTVAEQVFTRLDPVAWPDPRWAEVRSRVRTARDRLCECPVPPQHDARG